MTNTLDKIVYTATVTGGRRGGGTNPEQLFAVGYGACFTGALGLAGKAEGIDTRGATTDVSVGFGPAGDWFGISVDLAVTIPGVDDPTAQKLVDRTHELPLLQGDPRQRARHRGRSRRLTRRVRAS